MEKSSQRLMIFIIININRIHKSLYAMSFSDDGTKNNFSESNKNTNINNIEIFKNDIKKLSYEESIEELETILSNVQDENISLDKIQNNYIKGIILLKHCDELLQFVEQEINEINPEFLNID